jgi:hypothetical protein
MGNSYRLLPPTIIIVYTILTLNTNDRDKDNNHSNIFNTILYFFYELNSTGNGQLDSAGLQIKAIRQHRAKQTENYNKTMNNDQLTY